MYGENMANMANMANVANMPHMENIPYMENNPYMTSPYSYETCDYGYSYPVAPVAPLAGVGCYRGGGGFALIVVLFILLIIIGATCYSSY
jgi:uncharacterized protein (TIGR01732 family)